IDLISMALEGEQLLAGGGVPDLHRLVGTPRGEAPAVWAERHAPEAVGMPLKGGQLLAGGGVPDLHHVSAPRRAAPAVRAARHACNKASMALEGPHFDMA